MSVRSVRRSVSNTCLWLAVLTMAISVGGNVFQMVVIDPIWSASPPESVRAFFVGTPFLAALRRFHLNPIFLVGEVCLLGTLVLNWKVPTLRKWILLAVGINVLLVLGTILYVYPINDVLIVHAGGGLDATALKAMTHRWLMADRIRFIFKLAAFLCLLRALNPLPTSDSPPCHQPDHYLTAKS